MITIFIQLIYLKIYIKTKRVVYNVDCEIISFTLEFLSKNTSTD